jgi:hypothetical protein
MASKKLWIIGDSFFTRCVDSESPFPNTAYGKLPNASWTEQFANNINAVPEYYWAYGSLSNQSILLGLDCVLDQPRFNLDTDTVLCGFTATSRQIVAGSGPVFDRKLGLRNEVEGSIVGTTFLDQGQLPMGNANAEKLLNARMLTPEIRKLIQQYYQTLYPIEFDEYMQCMTIDGAITRAKQRGIDIIPHAGFIDYPYWNTDYSVQQSFDWINNQMFSAPCFNSVYKYALEQEEQFSRYSNHMSPSTNKQYADSYTEYYNDR